MGTGAGRILFVTAEKIKSAVDKSTDMEYTDYIIYGGVAQLGERLTGSQEVMGSIPTVSTTLKPWNRRISGLFHYFQLSGFVPG